MKKAFALLLLLASFGLSRAQVLIRLQLPPVGLTLKTQLWNLSLVNTSLPMTVQLEVLMTNASNNQKVLSGITRPFLLSRGLNVISPSIARPVTYNVLSQDYNLNVSQDGFLPVGTYNVCYNVVSLRSDALERIAEECDMVDVEPVSPPQLVMPGDREELELTRPLFNWLPPAPVSLFRRLVYDFVLVEMAPMQTAGDAVQKNIPLHAVHNISSQTLQYPLSLPELDKSKTYAWQVTAKSAGNPIAKSEIWSFHFKEEINEGLKNVADFYTKLKRDPDASLVICKGVLQYSYADELNDKNVSIKLYDITDAKRKEIKLDSSSAAVSFGENFKQLDFKDQPLADRHLYLLQLVNSANEYWYLRFEYRRPN